MNQRLLQSENQSQENASTAIYSLSYEAMLAEFEEISRRILPSWDATNLNDDIVKLTRLYLQAIARSNKFVSNLIQETNPQTIKDIRSIRNWIETFGIKTYTRQPAIAIVRIIYETSSDVVVEPYELELSISSDRGTNVFFQNTNSIIFRANRTNSIATFVEGLPFKEIFTYNNEELITLSQRFITDELFLKKSLYVKVNGVLWNRTSESNFNRGANLYDLQIDLNEQGRIVFGDRIKGNKPEVGSEIEISYRGNFGTQGNVSATFDTNNFPTNAFSVRNPQRFPFIEQALLNADTSGAADTPSVRDLKKFIFAGINYGGQLNNEVDINRFLLTIPGVKQVKTSSLLFDIRSTLVIEYFSESIRNALQSNLRGKIPTLFNFFASKSPEIEKRFRVIVFKTNTVSDQYVRGEISNVVSRFLDYENIDSLTGNYTNPIGNFVYLSTLGFAVKSISGVFDYEIEVYDMNGVLIASSTSKEKTQSKYLNDTNSVTLETSVVEVIIR